MLKLLSQSPRRIGRPAAGASDRIPDSLASGTPKALKEDLEQLLGQDRVLSRVIDLVRYASDASPYRLVPQVVVTPHDTAELAAVLRYCNEHGRHATFRAGGTSLCGQSQGDDIIIDTRKYWSGMKMEGETLRVRPGTTLGQANAVLARRGRQLGPDPASGSAACIGGVIANNAAGMRCTSERSAYETLIHATLVLPSGDVIDTQAPDAEDHFVRVAPRLAAGLMEIREEIVNSPSLVQQIRAQFAIRNTTGYAMKAFLDADTPLEIFRRLVVGSEGTLAFVAEAVMATVAIPAVTGLCWIHTPSLAEAVEIVPLMRDLGARAVEMVQGASIANYAKKLTAPPVEWVDIPAEAASLLVEFGADSEEDLEHVNHRLQDIISQYSLLHPVKMTTDQEFIALSWKLRGNMNADFALQRPEGSPIIQEDVCFPPEKLAGAVKDLSEMLERYGYPHVVAGHAMFGNMHFSVTPDLNDPVSTRRYGEFMDEFATLVVEKYNGSLKAEHGTGINFAPFVVQQWGEEITNLMWRIRNLADPNEILGRNVLLTQDPQGHMKRFRTEPPVEAVIDPCIECGLCEPVCPSRHITTTPRQRIALRREMARHEAGSPVLEALLDDYQYDAIETCAVDSSCSITCPYGIDTGAVMKEFRGKEATRLRNAVWLSMAKHWGLVEGLARRLMVVVSGVQKVVGHQVLQWVTKALRTVISEDLMPTVPGPMPRAAKATLPTTERIGAAAVYFPACVNRIFGRDPQADDNQSLPEALVKVSERAGRHLWIPDDVRGNCCGTIWSSKGYHDGRDYMYEKIARNILQWTDYGTLPLVVDASSCTFGLVHDLAPHLPPRLRQEFSKVEIIDSTAWAASLLDAVTLTGKVAHVVVHPGCSVAKLGLEKEIRVVAEAVAEHVHVPYGAGCCGTAGDRGLLHPELVESATKDELEDLPYQSDAFLASNRTCEMGLSQRTGRPYESVIFQLEKVTKP